MKFLYEENMVTLDNIKYRNIHNIICMYIRLVKYKYILEKKNVHYMHFASGYV